MKLKYFIAKTPEARYISAAWYSWLHCPFKNIIFWGYMLQPTVFLESVPGSIPVSKNPDFY
jgi:hypothetical protein